MADGANHPTKRKLRAALDADDAHQQHESGLKPKWHIDTGHGHKKDRPRIAFTGEEYGFGYQAARAFIEVGRSRPIYDGGIRVAKARTEQEFRAYSQRVEAGENEKFDFQNETPQPLRTKEQALTAVKAHTADFAVVPFYHPYSGYDFETLRTLGALGFLLGVEQVEATDQLCLAAHESQLFDIIQSSHPGTGFSALQRRMRKSWGAVDPANSGGLESRLDGELPRAGLPIDQADQKLIRDRIDSVFAGPEAARRCKSKLDGMRSIGIAVQEISQMTEPHRELARLARQTVNTSRQTNTFYDPRDGKTHFVSTLGAEAQSSKLYGMVLPYEVAMRSSDYVIVEPNMDDAPAQKTRFMAVEYNLDHTLLEDAYRTTDAKTRYWYKRLSGVALAAGSLETQLMKGFGAIALALGLTLLFFGALGASNLSAAFLTAEITKWLSPVQAQMAVVLGAILSAIGWLFLQAQGGAKQGVRVMLRFLRNQTAASIGDVEDFLRNHGVRHAVVRTDEDSEGHEPAPVVLDMEFSAEDFGYSPFSILSGRRLQNSVVNGALKKAFARWKNRGVTVIAAMPIQHGFQLPPPKARRWWSEAVSAWFGDFAETLFIRLTRILVYVLPVAFLAYVVWAWMNGDLG